MGGSERVVYDLARKFDRTAFEVIIIGFDDGPVRGLYETIGIKVFSVPKVQRLDLSFIRRLRDILRAEQIDVVNAHHFGPFLYTSLATIGLRTKLIYTEHSRWQLEELSLLKKVINRILLARTNGVLAISRQIENYYLRKLMLSRGKIHFIGNGIDVGLYRRKDGQFFRQSLGIDVKEKVIGMVANLRPEKNHHLLITAFSSVARVIHNVKLVLAGEDCMDGEVQRFAAQNDVKDRILFLGQRDDIPDLLSIFDVFCLPSVHEGLPLTILEAMAAGIPVVGSDVLGINEVIVDGSNGLLFAPGNAEELAERLILALTNQTLSNQLSSAGRDFVVQNYCLDEKVDQYQHLFSSLHVQMVSG